MGRLGRRMAEGRRKKPEGPSAEGPTPPRAGDGHGQANLIKTKGTKGEGSPGTHEPAGLHSFHYQFASPLVSLSLSPNPASFTRYPPLTNAGHCFAYHWTSTHAAALHLRPHPLPVPLPLSPPHLGYILIFHFPAHSLTLCTGIKVHEESSRLRRRQNINPTPVSAFMQGCVTRAHMSFLY